MIGDGNSGTEEKKRGEVLLEISGSGLRDCSSPQTPAPLHRSLIKDSLCPRAAPLSAEGPSRLCSECLPVLLQVDSTQLSPRDEQKSGFQSPGPLAFPSLWEIKGGTSARFTLHPSPQSLQKTGDEEEEDGEKEETCKGVMEGWSQGHRVISEEQSGAPFPLWSSSSVVTEK